MAAGRGKHKMLIIDIYAESPQEDSPHQPQAAAGSMPEAEAAAAAAAPAGGDGDQSAGAAAAGRTGTATTSEPPKSGELATSEPPKSGELAPDGPAAAATTGTTRNRRLERRSSATPDPAEPAPVPRGTSDASPLPVTVSLVRATLENLKRRVSLLENIEHDLVADSAAPAQIPTVVVAEPCHTFRIGAPAKRLHLQEDQQKDNKWGQHLQVRAGLRGQPKCRPLPLPGEMRPLDHSGRRAPLRGPHSGRLEVPDRRRGVGGSSRPRVLALAVVARA